MTLNNMPLAEIVEADLRAALSVVPQRVHLFSATLRDNLRLAAPDCDDEQLCAALRQVALDKLLEGDGLNQWLGEGGRQLSGGELRRLGLARAFLHQGGLLLLDEPTEGLDAGTEHHILDLIDQISRDKTLIMVTHRLNGLSVLDRIIVMDNGQIIEQGNHATLLEQHGRYWQFHQRM